MESSTLWKSLVFLGVDDGEEMHGNCFCSSFPLQELCSLLGTSASLLVTSALLVVTRFATRNKVPY